MLDKEMLSKQKYIYHVYESSDKSLHVEQYPVVYINKKYVYFKKPGDDMLSYRDTRNVKDSLASLDYYSMNLQYMYNSYFWNVEDNPKEVLSSLRKELHKKHVVKLKADAEKEVEMLKRKYGEALNRLEKYNAMEEECNK